jgi:sigma-B regulation protein RsbU (phosphoserine phosphatase)
MGSTAVSASQIARRANEILLETVRPQEFVTAFIGVLDPRTGEVTYCNAGHDPPILMAPNGKHRRLETGGPILGVFRDIPFEEGRFRLGDNILLGYTDGATEARNARDEEFGEDRLIRALRKNRKESPSKICRLMHVAVKDFYKGLQQTDDITFLAVKRTP